MVMENRLMILVQVQCERPIFDSCLTPINTCTCLFVIVATDINYQNTAPTKYRCERVLFNKIIGSFTHCHRPPTKNTIQ